MPNSTVPHLRSMVPERVGSAPCRVEAVDEYVQTDLRYLELLEGDRDQHTLLALVGVQSHQFQRALDLAALARERGVESCVIGGPHAMTCDTSMLHGRGELRPGRGGDRLAGDPAARRGGRAAPGLRRGRALAGAARAAGAHPAVAA
jgi:hypothetical protein